MKKLIFLAVLSALCFSVKAQDIIVKKDGSTIKAKILEVSKTEIKYKSYDNQTGPSFIISSSDVDVVKYNSGSQAKTTTAENEVKRPNALNTSAPIKPGMNYGLLKKIYDRRNYMPEEDDRYSLGLCGAMSFLVPGVGQIICGEPGRGIAQLAGSLTALAGSEALMMVYDGDEGTQWLVGSYICIGLALAIDVHSIVNAVHMAQIKNMYNQDLRTMKSVNVSFVPVVAPVRFGNDSKPYVGMSARIVF